MNKFFSVILLTAFCFAIVFPQYGNDPAYVTSSRSLYEEEVKPASNINVLDKKWQDKLKELSLDNKNVFFCYLLKAEEERGKNIINSIEYYMQNYTDIEWVLVTDDVNLNIENGKRIVDTLTVQQEHEESFAKQLNLAFSPIFAYYNNSGDLEKWSMYLDDAYLNAFLSSLKEEQDLLLPTELREENAPLPSDYGKIVLGDIKNGSEVSMESLMNKPLIMSFVWTQEITSRKIVQHMNDINKKFNDKLNVVILWVPADGEKEKIEEMIKEYPELKFLEAKQELETNGNVVIFDYAPKTFIIENNMLKYTYLGIKDLEQIINERILK